MAEFSGIEWTTHTFNPWIGCTKVSLGCKNCYAETLMDKTTGRVQWGPKGLRVRTKTKYWNQPAKWNIAAKDSEEPSLVFCASLADVFEGRESCTEESFKIMEETRKDLWNLIEATPYLVWLLLTKRPENIFEMIPGSWKLKLPDNIWLGTSVEDQETAHVRIPPLLKINAKVHWLSCEPLIGPVDLSRRAFQMSDHERVTNKICPLTGLGNMLRYPSGVAELSHHRKIQWIIAGGESGPGKRPMDLAWARSLREQCSKNGVAYFFKQIDKIQSIPDDLLVHEFPLGIQKIRRS